MTELSVDQDVDRKESGLQSYPVKDNDILYKGGLVTIDTDGYAEPAVDTAGHKFAGVAYEKVDNTLTGHSAGGKNIRVYTRGVFLLTCTGITQAMVGQLMYVKDDDVVDDTSSYWVCAGRLVQFVGTDQGWVDIGDRQIDLANRLDDQILAFGDDQDITIVWDGDELILMPAASAQQVSFGDASHVVYLKLHGSLAITEKELTVVMASAGDPAASFTQQAAGPALVCNRLTLAAGYLARFQINGTDVFSIAGDTRIATFSHRVKAASFGIEGTGDGINVYDQGTITTFTMDVHGGIIIAFAKQS